VLARAALPAHPDEHGRQPRGVGLALRGDRHRQRAARPLGRRARAAGIRPRLGPQGPLDGPPQRDRRLPVAVAPRHHPRLADLPPRHVAEDQQGVGQPAARLALGEGPQAGRAAGAARGRDEHDRLAHVAPAEDARQLEQRRGGRQLRAAAALGGVAVGGEHDPAARQAGPDADDGVDGRVALDGVGLGALAPHLEPGTTEVRLDAVGQGALAWTAGEAGGEGVGELLERLRGTDGVEGVGRDPRGGGRRAVA